MQHIKRAHDILDRAIVEHTPDVMILSYSGGYDSAVSSHLAARWFAQCAYTIHIATMSVDTLISADGWKDYVITSAWAMSLPNMVVWETDRFAEWATRVTEYGFPYTRDQHRINFYYLKQTVFRRVLKAYKRRRDDRVLFVNGVRRAESAARANAAEMYKQGSMVHVQPIVDWTDEQVETYRIERELPGNPFYDRIGNSGDCLCNWHTRFRLSTIADVAPKAAARIAPLHHACLAKYRYGYGMQPPNGTFSPGAGVQMELPGLDDTPDLCAACRRPGADNETRASVLLNRMTW